MDLVDLFFVKCGAGIPLEVVQNLQHGHIHLQCSVCMVKVMLEETWTTGPRLSMDPDSAWTQTQHGPRLSMDPDSAWTQTHCGQANARTPLHSHFGLRLGLELGLG